jgi:hypothetical protein
MNVNIKQRFSEDQIEARLEGLLLTGNAKDFTGSVLGHHHFRGGKYVKSTFFRPRKKEVG